MSPRRLLFATRNEGKLAELRRILADLDVELVSAAELALPDVEEDGATFEENAIKKARTCALASGLMALADDSGLEVDALDGAPGVHSARYAGDAGSDANVDKLLAALSDVAADRRTARFRCVLALVDPTSPDEVLLARGTCEGVILRARRGTHGFGYDPVFAPLGSTRSMAELEAAEKDAISHRGQALTALRSELANALALLL